MKKILRKIKQKTRPRTRVRSINKKVKTTAHIYRTDGLEGVSVYLKSGVKKRLIKHPTGNTDSNASDVLVISIDMALLDRYRADHTVEQLQSTGVTVDKVYFYELTKEHARRYNTFIFYRCPWMDEFKEFFEEAKKRNKVLIYSVDDLVIDTKYTDNIPVVQAMNAKDRKLYDEGVNRHRKVLEHCDYATVTTTHLADEIKKYKNIKKVFINRNAMSEEMVHCSNRAIKEVNKDKGKIVIGYFSGTATHNEDFKLVAPALVKILNKHSNTYIKLAGRVDAPDELKGYEDRLIYTPYVDWRKLPFELRKSDIILAPLVDTFFNRAKSEIKWSEGALVGVPVVASNMGAFKENIKNNETGLLAENTPDDWFQAIDKLVKSEKMRHEIGGQSRQFVLENCRTIGKNAVELKTDIENITPKIIGFAGVSLGAISGGNIIVKKHMDILQEAGYIVYGIESMEYKEKDKWLEINREDDKKYDIFRVNSSRKSDKVKLNMSFDKLVATFWPSVDTVDSYKYMKAGGEKLYLVQNMEAGFYKETERERIKAMATYSNPRLRPITISKWCQTWLKSDFGRTAEYAPNGIDIKKYKFKNRDFTGRKIRVLVEGDSASDYKNVDESFKITNKLDRDRYEVSYLSYNAEPKDWYKVDSVYMRVPIDQVGKVYEKHDILIKSSVLESFSLPPLEMMAVGGVPILVRNGGNGEYIKDGENALYYERGNIEDALSKVEGIATNLKKFKFLAKNGEKAAKLRDWQLLKKDITALYK